MCLYRPREVLLLPITVFGPDAIPGRSLAREERVPEMRAADGDEVSAARVQYRIDLRSLGNGAHGHGRDFRDVANDASPPR